MHNLSAYLNKTLHKILTKSMKNGMQVKGTRSWCVLIVYVKDNYYARFYDPSYHRYIERLFSVLLVKKSEKVNGV